MNGLDSLLTWISEQGFAIAIAVYLLTRLETKIDRLIDLVEKSIYGKDAIIV